MRIGVVAYELEGSRSGVGRYLEGLLTGIAELEHDSEWHLFLKGEPFDSPLFQSRPTGPRIVPHFDGRPKGSVILWEQLRLPALIRRAEVDAVVSPGYSLPPFVGVPRMVTLHDLSFEHLGSEFAVKERWRRRILARLAARRGDRVLADTAAIAGDLQRTYGIAESKIGVVPLAVDEHFFQPDTDADLTELGIEGPYLLHLGTLLPRRCLSLILEAFAAVSPRFPELKLVLAGQNHLPDPLVLDRSISAAGLINRVIRLDYVPEQALTTLYARARASFYLSTYEGYGLPPLESLAAGTPALVSGGLALDDLAPRYPWRTELDLTSVTATLERILKHEDPAASIRDARDAIHALTWRQCAERYIAQLKKAMANRGNRS